MNKENDNINIHLSYPFDPEYEYHTKLTRLHLDNEREEDIKNDRGFVVAPTQGIKKDLKNPFSIFSYRFGQTIKDINPFGNRYRCKCGFLQNKINNGCTCKICGTKVQYVDDNYEYFGWLVLQDYWVISPAFYNALRFFIGKDFDSIIKHDTVIDEDGHQKKSQPKAKDSPYYGIGLIEFKDRFDEIMEYYFTKNKKQVNYEDIMSNKDKVFTQSIPVFTVLLRPYDVDKYTFSHETTNNAYTMINKLVSKINEESALLKSTNLNKDNEQPKPILDLLYNLQLKMDKLYNEIIDIIKGKKGNIRTLFGGRYNFTSRNVITADPSLRIDEVRLPYSTLLELLQQSIINILTKTYNLSYSDAYRRWYEASLKKDSAIINIIDSMIKNSTNIGRGLPVIINRNPTIGYGSILQVFCVGISDTNTRFEYVMQVPLQILPLLAADFDGDVLNILYIINKAFFERSYEVFNPRNAFYISRNDGLFNNLVNHQKDTLINANSLMLLGRHIYTEQDIATIKNIKAMWG